MKVVLLVVDSLRADAPGFAGGSGTPHMDDLAGEGTRFERSWASGSWTVPSLAAMVTGAFPHRVGIVRWRHAFPVGQPCLLQSFAAAGFDVRCLTPNPRWAFRTFPGHGGAGRSDELDEVQGALRAPRGTDRFVLIHHWWTHLPYVQRRLGRGGWRRACDLLLGSLGREPAVVAPRLRGLYSRAVEAFDREWLPRVLDAALSGGDDVVVALTGDHGENWGESLPAGRKVEHVFDLHGRWLDDGTSAVPLIFWGKGTSGPVPQALCLGGFARGVDVAPTLCDLEGLPWPLPAASHEGPTLRQRGPSRSDGLSLLPAIRASLPAPAPEALTVATHNVFFPDVYPEEGAVAFRRFGLRTKDARYLLDVASGEESAVDLAGATLPAELAAPVLARLGDEHSASVDPGPPLPEDLFGRAPRAGVPGADDLAGRMATLGYLD